MIAYVDSSVLLRVVFAEPARLAEWGQIDTAVSSVLCEVECLRTLDRLHRQGFLGEGDLAERRGNLIRSIERFRRVDITPSVLRRAADPFPVPLGTLDALHLVTALLYAAEFEVDLVLATHDHQLARAARSMGLTVLGA